MTTHKETLYKTAFSPLFGVYVGIQHAYQDSRGEWIFVCKSDYNPEVVLKDHLFRKHELTNFCL